MNIIYIITSILLITSYLLIKKKEEKQNIVYSIIISVIIFLTYNIFVCTIMFFAKIRSTLLSLSIFNIIFSILPIYFMVKNKEVQKYYLNKIDLISVIIILIAAITLVIKNYGTNIAIKHGVTDAATHFFAADDFYKYSTLAPEENSDKINWLGCTYLMTGAYVNTGIFFKLFDGIINEVFFLKLYFIFDIFIWILSGLLMYTLLAVGNEKKKDKILALIFTFFYILAYQMNSLFAGFSYLGIGLDIIIGILIIMKIELPKKYRRIFLFFLDFGIMFSYYYFSPIIFITIFWQILKDNKKNGIKIFSLETMWDIVIQLIIPGIIGVVYFIILPLIASDRGAVNYAGAIATDGFIYKNFIGNILPYVLLSEVYLIYNAIKKKNVFLNKLLLLSIIFWAIVYCGYSFSIVSSYYFYKIYYMLFIVLIASSFEMVKVFTDEKKIVRIIVYIFISIYSIGIIFSMITKKSLYIFDVYSNNGEELQSDYALVKENEFKLFDYYNKNINTMNNDDTLWCLPQGNTGRDRWVYSITKNPHCLNEVLSNNKNVTIDTFTKRDKYKYFVVLKNDYNGEYDKIEDEAKRYNLKILIKTAGGMILEKQDLAE